jgi:hypothetical protein
MSVQIAPLNYSAHVWSPASWGDLDGFQGLLGVGADDLGVTGQLSTLPQSTSDVLVGSISRLL